MSNFTLSTAPTVEAETRYCPSDWLDEIVPVLVADPVDCVYPLGPTGWTMLDDEASKDDEENYCRLQLEPGQIVAFAAHRRYGTFELVVEDDGSYEIDPYPADATHFAHENAEFEQMFNSVDELLKKGDPESLEEAPMPPGIHQVRIWFWSTEDISFRFEVEDGKPKFVRCAGAN